jgi:hypothetical protein
MSYKAVRFVLYFFIAQNLYYMISEKQVKLG